MWMKHRTSIILGVFYIVLLSGFWLFPTFAFIFFIATLMDLLLEPVVAKLSKKMPRTLAALITVFITLIIISVVGIILTQSFVPTLRRFMNELPLFAQQLQALSIAQSSPYITASFDELWGEVSNLGMTMVRNSVSLLLSTFNKLIDFIVVVFVTFYLLKDGEMIENYVVNLFPAKSSGRVRNLMDNIMDSLQIYVRAQLIMCCITGVVVFAYFTLCELPYASVFAVVSGLGELVPVLGPTVASFFGTMLTATQEPMMAVQTGIFYLILTQINHNIVYPYLIGKSLKLHPVAIILGVIFGGELLDAAGMFLAVPCIVVIKHVVEDIHQHSKTGE